MTEIRWSIIGPGIIARHFADGLAEALSAILAAVAGSNPDRLRRFADKYRLAAGGRYNDVREICAGSDVDALYTATPHSAHAEIAIMAMRCGKRTLCEKPAAGCLLHGRADVSLPPAERMLEEIIRAGDIGAISLPIDDVSQCPLSQLPLGRVHLSSISAMRTSTCRQPCLCRAGLAFWAMPVATGIVRDVLVCAVFAPRNMTAKRRRPTTLNRAHDLQLGQADMARIGHPPRSAMGAEDVRNLQM